MLNLLQNPLFCESCASRSVYSAAVWYYNHLQGAKNVVMITEKQDVVARYSCLNCGVFAITLQVQKGRSHLEFCISSGFYFKIYL